MLRSGSKINTVPGEALAWVNHRIHPRDGSAATVIKRDGSRQPFNREKIRAGLVLACRKRPVTGDDMDSVISQVERHFAEIPDREVLSAAIGEQLLRVLRGVDEVAYVRFASVYREFSDVNHFVMELDRLQRVDSLE